MKNWNQGVVIGLSIIIGFILHAAIVNRGKVVKGVLGGNIWFTSGEPLLGDGREVEIHKNYIVVSDSKGETIYRWDNIESLYLKQED